MSLFLRSTLGVVCTSCDGYNPPQAVRCAACGTGLQASAPPAAAGRPPPPRAVAPVSFPPAAVPRRTAPVPPGLKPSNRTPAPVVGVAPPVVPPPAAPLPRAPTPVPSPASRGPAPATGPRFGLSVVAGRVRGARYRLPPSGATVGAGRASIVLSEDPYLSPHHATLLVREGTLYVRDEASVSGVYVAIAGQEVLLPGAFFSAGPRLFRYGGPLLPPTPTPGHALTYGAPMPTGQALYLVEEVLVGGRAGRAIVSGGPLVTVGSGPCELSYPGDEGLAARHCELSPNPASALLRDLSGALGTFVRLPPGVERPLRVGDRIRVGVHVLQVEPPT